MESLDKTMEDFDVEEQAIFDACKVVLACNLSDARPAAYHALADMIGQVMTKIAETGDANEYFGSLTTSYQATGYFTLKHLCEGPMGQFDVTFKHGLTTIADILGADQLDNLRRNVAFMIKVEGFN